MSDDVEKRLATLDAMLALGPGPAARVKLSADPYAVDDACPNTANAAGPHEWRPAAGGAARQCKFCGEVRADA